MKTATKCDNPFAEGAEARRRGRPKSSNPYGTASRQWTRWNCGYDSVPEPPASEPRKEETRL